MGRITEFNGLEGTGKSLVGAHILANAQRKGVVAIYIDTETSVSPQFLTAIGVDVKNMIYDHVETVEEIFEHIENIVTKVREQDKGRLVTILVDSIAAASTKVEMEADFDKDGWATSKAIIISKAMRKITQMIGKQRVALVFTNQLRQKLGAMFGDQWTTSGGKALPFHASVRVRLKNAGRIKVGTGTKEQVVGMKIKAQVIKNRMGPPLRQAEFNLSFASGIDDIGSWIRILSAHKIVKQAGAWYTIEYEDKEIKFQAKKFEEVLEKNPKLEKYLYDQICEKTILKYRNSPDEPVVLDAEVEEIEEMLEDDS